MAQLKEGQVSIRGKVYDTVALRVKRFRELHPDWSIVTGILFRDETEVVMRAEILNEQGRLIATGHSEEKRKKSQINETSALENAETSAIGRALAALGMGGTEFASADEVANAIGQQKASTKPVSQDVWDSLTSEAQTWLQGIADSVRIELNEKGPKAAMTMLEEQGLDSDHKVALWSRFDSKERAAMKGAKNG